MQRRAGSPLGSLKCPGRYPSPKRTSGLPGVMAGHGATPEMKGPRYLLSGSKKDGI